MRQVKRRVKGAGQVDKGAERDGAGELLGLEEAIGHLKTTRSTFYRWVRSGKLKGLKVGHKWRFRREELERFMAGEAPRVELGADISPLMEALRERLLALGGKEPRWDDEPPVLKAILLMIVLGQKMRATDLSIEPGHKQAYLRYRIDGVLHPAAQFDIRLLPAIVDQWKTLCNCNVQEKSRPQDGRAVVEPPQVAERMDLRICILPAVGGESLTARLLTTANAAATFDIERIGFSPADKARVIAALGRPCGLVIVTGPTGTGKTTMLYAFLQRLMEPGKKIVTIEDPVECAFDGMTQVQVRPDATMTFAAVLRATFRSAANVIMVGETRDGEVANMCFQGALTGLMVLTTLHTNDAPSAIKRLLDISVPAHLVADGTTLILAQRLVRRLCPHCSKEDAHPPMLEQAKELSRRGGLEWSTLSPQFRTAVGCARCSMTGYAGRMLVAEVMPLSAEVSSAIRREASTEELRAIAIGQGMTTMPADGIAKAAAGMTTIEEVVRTMGG